MIGKTLAHYEITSQLGRGGMGEVYRATDKKLGRDVAIKVLPEELARNADRVARFQHEAKMLASLNHPNIASIYGLEESGGMNFLVMELVEGETLADRISRGPIPLEESMKLALKIASGLEAAHKKGIIHRDLKPANIMVGEEDSVRLLDFGLAKLFGQDAQGPDAETVGFTATQTGAVLGTIAYMSPEQAQGQPVDGRSDVFSFGLVLYEMLSGRRAFPGTNSFEIMTAIVKEDPSPLRSVPSLDQIVQRCLAKKPSARYKAMTEVRVALEKAREKLVRDASSEKQPSIAVLPFVNMSGDQEQEYFSDGLTEEIINALAQISELKVIARTSSFAFRKKEQDIRRIAEALNVTTLLEGSVRKAGNRVRVTAQLIHAADGSHLWSERYDRDLTDVFAIQDEISQAIADKLRVHLAGKRTQVKPPTVNMEAYNLNLKGRYYLYKITPEGTAKAKEYFEQVIEMDPNFASAWHGMAASYHISAALGMVPSGVAIEKSRQAVLKALELDEMLPDAHAHLGMLLASEYDWKRAEAEFLRAMELGSGWHLYAFYYLLPMRRFDEALVAMRKEEDLNPISPLMQTGIASIYNLMGQYDKAVVQCETALELDPNVPLASVSLAMAHIQKGETEKGVRIVEVSIRSSGRNAFTQGILAWVYASGGRTTEAQQMLEELLVSARDAHVPAVNIAMIYMGLGEIEECFDWLFKAAEQRDSTILQLFQFPTRDSLRSHPRYKDLLRKLNLEP